MVANVAWPSDVAAAIDMQRQLRGQVTLTDAPSPPRTIAGLDVGYDPATNTSHAVGVLIDIEPWRVRGMHRAELATSFPYIPGYLSFREVPVLLAVIQQFATRPDLVMVDGHGVAHPRRFGVASHLGVISGLPTIGVAKSRLCGHHAELGPYAGDRTALYDRNEQIGTVLRSKANCLPLYISPGHCISHASALAITMACLKGYRLPEPTRLADKYSKQAERQKMLELL